MGRIGQTFAAGAARWRTRAAVLLGFVGLIWAVSLVGLFVQPVIVREMAIVPRSIDHLGGVLGAIFVHGSLAHLTANTPPLFVLGGMVMARGPGYCLRVMLAIAVAGGLGVWAFARDAAHIGASGLIFGLFGFLVARGWTERRWQSVAMAAAALVLYGGLVAGVVPRDDQISWEGHLFGLIAGVLCARAPFAVRR